MCNDCGSPMQEDRAVEWTKGFQSMYSQVAGGPLMKIVAAQLGCGNRPAKDLYIHCDRCGFCVLFKVHHCGLMGGCVGWHNCVYFVPSAQTPKTRF